MHLLTFGETVKYYSLFPTQTITASSLLERSPREGNFRHSLAVVLFTVIVLKEKHVRHTHTQKTTF